MALCAALAAPAAADHIKNPSDAQEHVEQAVGDTRAESADAVGTDTYQCTIDLRGRSEELYAERVDLAGHRIPAFGGGYFESSREYHSFATPNRCVQADVDGERGADEADSNGSFDLNLQTSAWWWGDECSHWHGSDQAYYYESWNGYYWETIRQDFRSQTKLHTPEGVLTPGYDIWWLGAGSEGSITLWGSSADGTYSYEGRGELEVEANEGWPGLPWLVFCPEGNLRIRGTFELTVRNNADNGDPPTGLPGVGPTDAGRALEDEEVEPIAQPDWRRDPLWRGAVPGQQDSAGYFGQSFGGSGEGPYVTVGGGRVFVKSAAEDRVYVFDAREPATKPLGYIDGQGSPGGALADPTGLAYYRGELYVAERAAARVSVLGRSAEGAWVRKRILGDLCRPEAEPLGCLSPLAQLEAPAGIDLAWGKLFVYDGDWVKVFDRTTGAFLYAMPQPLRRQAWELDPGPEPGRDVSTAPEAAMIMAGRRANPYIAGLLAPTWPNAATTALFCRATASGGRSCDQVNLNGEDPTSRGLDWCLCPRLRGTDWVWGMEWFMAVTEPADGWPVDPVSHYVEEHGGSRLRRRWKPRDADTGKVSDVAYQKRELRLDWAGPLAERSTHWLRGVQSLDYAVSDADIYVVGERGEHWFELAREFDRIELEIGGVPITEFALGSASPTEPGGTLRVDLGQRNPDGSLRIPTGVQELRLTAYLKDGTKLQSVNPEVWVDNVPPTGEVSDPGPFVRSTVGLGSSMTDEHSGPKDYQFQLDPPTSGWQDLCELRQAPPSACSWDTTAWPDGTYGLRGRMRDKALDADPANDPEDGNVGYTQTRSVLVDNTPPELSDFSPALGQTDNEEVFADDTWVRWTQTDNGGSGIANTDIYYNTSPGSCSGAWRQIGSNDEEGDVAVAWDTREVPSGLVCLRAFSRDRAGNETDERWQAVVGDERLEEAAPAVDYTPDRWYAGVGGIGKRKKNIPYSYGTAATLRVPAVTLNDETNAHGVEGRLQFTASWVANGRLGSQGGNRGWLEVGLMTQRNCGGGDEDPGGQDLDRWWLYGGYGHPPGAPAPGQYLRFCPEPAAAGSVRVRTELKKDSSTQELRGKLWYRQPGGEERLIYLLENDPYCKRAREQGTGQQCSSDDPGNYRLEWSDGLRFPRAGSEVNDPGRRMLGYFSELKSRRSQAGGYEYPLPGETYGRPDDNRHDGDAPRRYLQTPDTGIDPREGFCTFGPRPPFGSC